MIIQIRGTSGSGKSTVVKKLLSQNWDWTPIFKSGRKKPLYYKTKGIVVLGHYESPCGGCDTIGSAPKIFELIKEVIEKENPKTLICEGLLLSEDVKWTSQLVDYGLVVLYLTTPSEECLVRIKQRRSAVGNEKELNPSNTLNRVAIIEKSRVKLKEKNVKCIRTSSDQAFSKLMKLLKG